jgi:hypothetical protein
MLTQDVVHANPLRIIVHGHQDQDVPPAQFTPRLFGRVEVSAQAQPSRAMKPRMPEPPICSSSTKAPDGCLGKEILRLRSVERLGAIVRWVRLPHHVILSPQAKDLGSEPPQRG